MSTDPMIHIPAVVYALDKLGATYRIVPARSEEINDLVSWLERVFPLSHSQIDWAKVPSHRCIDWNDLDELVEGLQRLTHDLAAQSLVVVTFGNALCPSLELRLGDVNRIAREIFEQFETSQDI